MNANRESDDCVVPEKVANKTEARAGAAESLEERQSAKRKPQEQRTDRAQDRETVAHALERLRKAVRRDLSVGALMRHLIKAGARCGSAARRDLYGGCPARGIPTVLLRGEGSERASPC